MKSMKSGIGKILSVFCVFLIGVGTSIVAAAEDEIKAIEYEFSDRIIFIIPEENINGKILVVVNSKIENNINLQRQPEIKVVEQATEYFPKLENIESKEFGKRAMYVFAPYNTKAIQSITIDGIKQNWVKN